MSASDWSASEKKIARQAYERALEQRFERLLTEFREKAAAVRTPEDIWAVEDFLREQRRDIDRTFDYRYSQLIIVFAQLMRQGLMDETALSGLADDKLEIIRRTLAWAREAG